MYKVYFDRTRHIRWPILCDTDFAVRRFSIIFDYVFGGDYRLVGSIDEADFIFSEFSVSERRPGKTSVVICGESDGLYGYVTEYDGCRMRYIGTLEDSEISFNLPVLNGHCLGNDIYTLDMPKTAGFDERWRLNAGKNVFVRRNVWASPRESLAAQLRSVCRNGPDKAAILGEFAFNFCAENSRSSHNGTGGYITEKIYDAVSGGCIPIYWGGDIGKYTILNPDRMIDLSAGQSAVDRYLNMPESEAKRIYDLPVLRPDAVEFAEQRRNALTRFLLG